MIKRVIASFVCLIFSFSNLQYIQAQDFSVSQLPVPGTMIEESAPFAPLALKGLIVNPQKPLEFQFIVDTGKGPQDTASVKDQANQLVKYFLAGLTIPEGDLWVNLSPYEKNRMVPEALGQTDLGRDLLAQDYILKQLTASLIYPEKDLGKEFWSRVYAKAQKQFGTTNVPVNTFNKVWILPDQAQVFENVNAAYVTKSMLKVMLDEDYLAKQKHQATQSSSISSQIVREIIIPEITKEVNTGKNFAPLRQIYQALILAKWYKETIQNGLLDALYTNKNKVAGVNLNDPTVKEQIYNRYLQAYKKGAFNYIKEDPTPNGQVVLRKYFSGGISRIEPEYLGRTRNAAMIISDGGQLFDFTFALYATGAAAVLGVAAWARSKIQKAKQEKIEQVKRNDEISRLAIEKKLAEEKRVEELRQTDPKAYADELASQLEIAGDYEYNSISDKLHDLGDLRGDEIYKDFGESKFTGYYSPGSYQVPIFEWESDWKKVKRSDAAMRGDPRVYNERFRQGFLERVQEGKSVYAMIKPDGQEDTNTILEMLKKHFDVVQGPNVKMSPEDVGIFYEVHKGRPFYQTLIKYISEDGLVTPLFLTLKPGESQTAVELVNEVKQKVRREFVPQGEATKNKLHASDSLAAAITEINFIFNFLDTTSATQNDTAMLEESNNKRIIVTSKGKLTLRKELEDLVKRELISQQNEHLRIGVSSAVVSIDQRSVQSLWDTLPKIYDLIEKTLKSSREWPEALSLIRSALKFNINSGVSGYPGDGGQGDYIDISANIDQVLQWVNNPELFQLALEKRLKNPGDGNAIELATGNDLGTALLKAILSRDKKEVLRLLIKGADSNTKTADGVSALTLARMEGDKDIISILIDADASDNAMSGPAASQKDAAMLLKLGGPRLMLPPKKIATGDIAKVVGRLGKIFNDESEYWKGGFNRINLRENPTGPLPLKTIYINGEIIEVYLLNFSQENFESEMTEILSKDKGAQYVWEVEQDLVSPNEFTISSNKASIEMEQVKDRRVFERVLEAVGVDSLAKLKRTKTYVGKLRIEAVLGSSNQTMILSYNDEGKEISAREAETRLGFGDNRSRPGLIEFSSKKDPSKRVFVLREADAAMALSAVTEASRLNKTELTENGGIDFNQINVLRGGKKVLVHFDPAQLRALEQQGSFQGFTAVITGMERISSPLPLLGIKTGTH